MGSLVIYRRFAAETWLYLKKKSCQLSVESNLSLFRLPNRSQACCFSSSSKHRDLIWNTFRLTPPNPVPPQNGRSQAKTKQNENALQTTKHRPYMSVEGTSWAPVKPLVVHELIICDRGSRYGFPLETLSYRYSSFDELSNHITTVDYLLYANVVFVFYSVVYKMYTWH